MSDFLLKDDIQQIVKNVSDISHEFSGKRILLTGGRGFLGRYFMEIFNELNEKVLENKLQVIVLDNLITSGKEGSEIPNYKNIKFIKHNVIKKFIFEEKLDYIVHAAGIASPYYYRAYPLETLEVAIDGTKNMLELAELNSAKFTFFSSSEIYGDPDMKNVPTKESYRGNVSCTGPRACYDESKRVGETLCQIFHNIKGVHTNTIRPFNVFGPGMQETDYRVLPNFTSRIKANIPLQIYGTGNQRTGLTSASTNIGKKLYAEIQNDYIAAASDTEFLARNSFNARPLKAYEMQAITWVTWRRIHGITRDRFEKK